MYSQQQQVSGPKVVIVGGGFGGLRAAMALKHAPARIVVVDRANHHLFQPLLYQVATATLSPADIAYPIRSALSRQKNTEVLLAEVTGIDRFARTVRLRGGRSLHFDYLVLATGSQQSYFGHPEWAKVAPGLKDLTMATQVRSRILRAFEMAEQEPDATARARLMTFVLVGGGPTGVEMAGAIAELATRVIAADFRRVDPHQARVVLVEGSPRVLANFPENLSQRAEQDLKRMGVIVKTSSPVTALDENGVQAGGMRIESKNVFWTAGVQSSPVGQWLGEATDRGGRVKVTPTLQLPSDPRIFLVGDCASVEDDKGKPLPGLAPVAMQQGQYVAKRILGMLGKNTADTGGRPFHYFDKGNMATIGRSKAVVDMGWIHLSGFAAWVTWLAVHLFFLIGFRNRVLVLLQWAWAYIRFQSGARLIMPEAGES